MSKIEIDSGAFDAMYDVMKLVVSAAAKQTVGAQRLRAAGDGSGSTPAIKNNASAVGRLHNAAKLARAILPADVIAEIEAAAGDA